MTEEISVGQGRSGRAKSSGFRAAAAVLNVVLRFFCCMGGFRRVVSPAVGCPQSGGKQEGQKVVRVSLLSLSDAASRFPFVCFKEDYWLGSGVFRTVVFDIGFVVSSLRFDQNRCSD